jgi:hypothetical protein
MRAFIRQASQLYDNCNFSVIGYGLDERPAMRIPQM